MFNEIDFSKIDITSEPPVKETCFRDYLEIPRKNS